jgi:hypothetical protein
MTLFLIQLECNIGNESSLKELEIYYSSFIHKYSALTDESLPFSIFLSFGIQLSLVSFNSQKMQDTFLLRKMPGNLSLVRL